MTKKGSKNPKIFLEDGRKVCSRCGVPKPFTHDFFNNGGGGKFCSQCKECSILSDHERKAKRKGLTSEEYQAQTHPVIYLENGDKVCPRCGDAKPHIREYFYSNGNGSLKECCIECSKKADKNRRQIKTQKRMEEYAKTYNKYEKICKICGLTKPRTNEYFCNDKKSRDRLRYECKECGKKNNRNHNKGYPERHAYYNHKSFNKKYPKNSPERKEFYMNNYNNDKEGHANRRLKRTYGITLEDYNNQVKEQNGLCYICHQKPGGHHNKLVVDHCHISNNVRKLLCVRCNWALGSIEENVEILQGMIEYLEFFHREFNMANLENARESPIKS